MVLITYFMPESMLVPKNTEIVKLALPVQTGQMPQQRQTHTRSYAVTGRNGEAGSAELVKDEKALALPDTRRMHRSVAGAECGRTFAEC